MRDAENQRNAENHKGWEIQILTDEGWKADKYAVAFHSKELAEVEMKQLRLLFIGTEFRAYEALV